MSTALFACVHAGEFPTQALLRLRSDLLSEPVAVLDGRPPQECVCAMNGHALRLGVARGMTRLDAEGIAVLRLVARSRESEAAARDVMLEHAAEFSPRIEEASEGTACAFVLDMAGTERLFGPADKLAERLREDLAGAGFRVSIAVSTNFHVARMRAAASRGIHVIPNGAEAVALARLPIAALHLEQEHLETFAVWGIRTLGELAALPEVELIARLGQQARAWREAAWGMLPHVFEPIEPEFTLREFLAFEDPVEEMESLLFVGARMIDALVARAGNCALAVSRLTARMKLDGGAAHELVLKPAIPSSDRKFLLKLLQLEIAAHPPQAAVLNFELRAEAAQSSLVQLGLFAPQTPEPSRLDVTLARLKAIVGEDRVGAAVLEDSHRPGSFGMEEFRVDTKPAEVERDAPRMGLRRMRPPLAVRVRLCGAEPAVFWSREERYEITSAYGPWRTSGGWWSAGEWDVEEWDVLAFRKDGAGIACLLVRDQAKDEWRLEAVYD